MKRFIALMFVCGSLIFPNVRRAEAHQPLPTPPLSERVEEASYIFVGVVEKIVAIDTAGQEIPDDKLPRHDGGKSPEIHDLYMFQIRVEEPLSPTDWHPAKPVSAMVGGAWSQIDELREQRVGEKSIFLTRRIFAPHWGQVLVASKDYFIAEPVEKKAKILKLLKPNLSGARQWSHFEWLEQWLKEAEKVQPGMTRTEVEKLLAFNTSPNGKEGKYVFRECPYITVKIELDGLDHGGGKDKVLQVSKPTLEWVLSE